MPEEVVAGERRRRDDDNDDADESNVQESEGRRVKEGNSLTLPPNL